jgi:ABC-type Mn2+/Zn2+ transport system ATPase subunit
MSALLEVSALKVLYGKVAALHSADLRVDEGAIVTVIGPNGAGKSTLLGAIMGLLPSPYCWRNKTRAPRCRSPIMVMYSKPAKS